MLNSNEGAEAVYFFFYFFLCNNDPVSLYLWNVYTCEAVVFV